MKNSATRRRRAAPARKCLPSASTHCMRSAYCQRRVSPSRLCGRRRVGRPIRRHARHTVVRSIFRSAGTMPRSRARRTSSGAEARGSHRFSVRRKATSSTLSACEVVVRVRCRGSRAASLPLAQAARQRCSVRTLMCTKRPSRSTRSAPATWRTAAPAGHPPSTRASTSATTE